MQRTAYDDWLFAIFERWLANVGTVPGRQVTRREGHRPSNEVSDSACR